MHCSATPMVGLDLKQNFHWQLDLLIHIYSNLGPDGHLFDNLLALTCRMTNVRYYEQE